MKSCPPPGGSGRGVYHSDWMKPDRTMVQGCEKPHTNQLTASRAPRVSYQSSLNLADNVLAAFRFGSASSPQEDARVLDVALAPLAGDAHEIWTVDGAVMSG